MTTNFFTNETDNTLFDKFKGVFENNKNIKFFDTLVGYLRASGYFKISKLLADYNEIKLRILVGINIDILLAQANRAGNEFFKNSEKTEEEFLKYIEKDIKEAKYDKETDEGIKQFVKDIVEKKVQLKVHPEKKIHAKVYILRPEPFNEHTYGYTITGSSNFTDAGLGTVKNHNYEFNVLLNNYDDVRFATDEFERLWAEAIEIDPQHIQEVKENSHLNENVTPFELYIKLLSEYFFDMIDYNPQSLGDMPVHFKKLSYQIDAVNQGFSMLTKHNGFFLADVVGLGKTVVAALITRKFLFENGRDFTKALVVSPPAIAKNWKQTFHDFDIDKYTKFITNGSLQKIIEQEDDYWSKEEYDLVIVDEAHRFRNHQTDSFNKLQIICKSPRKNQGLITGKQKKVILVSATPLNNRPDDIFYQLQMFQDARQSTIPGVTNLTSFFSPLMEKFKKLKRFDDVDVNELIKIYDIIRNNVIKEITIRRTRKDLLENDDYLNDLKEQNITFPTVNPPKKIEYKMNKELNELFVLTAILLAGFSKDDDIKKEELILTAKFGIINENILKYSRYQAIAFLNEDKQREYSNAETTAKSLAFIMKTQLIKRLESSFYAFKKSLENFKKATDRMIDMFDKDKVF
nr:phospholipase D-like domain-containing protein [Candidatus Kapabacteria bacterium]